MSGYRRTLASTREARSSYGNIRARPGDRRASARNYCAVVHVHRRGHQDSYRHPRRDSWLPDASVSSRGHLRNFLLPLLVLGPAKPATNGPLLRKGALDVLERRPGASRAHVPRFDPLQSQARTGRFLRALQRQFIRAQVGIVIRQIWSPSPAGWDLVAKLSFGGER